MKKQIFGWLLTVCALTWFSTMPVLASATMPSDIRLPERGEYTMGEDSSDFTTDFYLRIENPKPEEPGQDDSRQDKPDQNTPDQNKPGTDDSNKNQGGTDDTGHKGSHDHGHSGGDTGSADTETEPGVGAASISGALPKTGDYGLNKNLFLVSALLFGSAYLLCDYYEKRQ